MCKRAVLYAVDAKSLRAAQATFAGADLRESNFANGDFTGADMRSVLLRGSDLSRAEFMNANLSSDVAVRGNPTMVMGSNLESANFLGAKLTGIFSDGNQGRPAKLPAGSAFFNGFLLGRGAILNPETDLSWFDSPVDLTGAKLRAVSFEHAYLPGVQLVGADLSYIYGANLDASSANLSNANLERAHLHGTNLQGADLTNVDLDWAELENANLGGTTGRPKSWANATFSNTTCPDWSVTNTGCW
ncbi:MAG: hypothetical protein B7C55_05800 [Actinomycetales bacterium mxb001]|nr:MAG: hypothetical protein B7C55_05800 [Actinomycetales bacterium mxb001]